MDLFGRIREEHRQIFDKIDELTGCDPETRHDKLNELALQILAHMDAEERTIYSALEDMDDTPRSIAIQNEEEHQAARYLLDCLRERGLDDEHRTAWLKILRNAFKIHVESEESIMFEQALDCFTQEEIDSMTERFDQAEVSMFKISKINLPR